MRVRSRRGAVVAPVHIDPGLRPGLAFMTMHFPESVRTNDLTIDATDPRSGTAEFKASADGFIESIQCEQVGLASLVLGGGRNKQDDLIDHAVGLELHKKTGDAVAVGEPLCTVLYNNDVFLSRALDDIHKAYAIGDVPPALPALIVERL